eukprot:GHUV01010510.1.p1 GENE.GHUV01010510.1~~GHUV01010510.1.p1  ORF type:complete len:202 (+),score=73.12 GHUV01010510.1:896-1501(+)
MHKVSLGFFGSYYHTWGLWLDGNTVHISEPVACTDTDPSATLLLYYIFSRAVKEAKEESDTPAGGGTNSRDAAGSSGGGHQGGPPDDDAPPGGGSRGPHGADTTGRPSRKGKTSQQPAPAGHQSLAAHADNLSDAIMGNDQQLLQQQQQQPGEFKVITDLAAAAAAAAHIDLDLVEIFWVQDGLATCTNIRCQMARQLPSR